MSIFSGPKIVNSGLVLNLDAANSRSYPGSGTTWNDLSGKSYNGTLTNGPSFGVDNNGNLNFDGTDDFVSVPFELKWNNTNSVTIIISVNPSGVGPFLGKTSYEWRFNKTSSTAFTFTHWDSNGGHSNGPVITINDMFENNKWVVIGFVWDHSQNKVRIYKNNQLYNSYDWTNASINRYLSEGIKVGGNIYGGGSGGINDSYYQGKIGPILIYNKTLTLEEIQQNYEAIRGRFNI